MVLVFSLAIVSVDVVDNDSYDMVLKVEAIANGLDFLWCCAILN